MFNKDKSYFEVSTTLVFINNMYEVTRTCDTPIIVDVYRTYSGARKGYYNYIATKTVAYQPNADQVELVTIKEIYLDVEATRESIFLEREET